MQLTAGAISLKLLLDTNAFIALEPASTAIEPGLQHGAELARLAADGGHQLYLHQDTRRDFARDPDAARRRARLALAGKYPLLSGVPRSTVADLVARLGLPAPPEPGSNHAVDLELLAAVEAAAADYLVTNDDQLRRRARRAGLAENVLPLAEAVQLLRDLTLRPLRPPPAVEHVASYQLDPADPIFDSLRQDYAPNFDRWFADVRKQHRPAWYIAHDDGRYAGVMIVKDETDHPYGLPGNILKLSTFKVTDEAHGRRYGELLLKTLFLYAHHREHDAIYVTVFDKHATLIELLTAFGFRDHGESKLRERVLVKDRRPGSLEGAGDPLDFHITYGPPAIDTCAPFFVVPVEPKWHDLLFPEYVIQQSLFTGEHPFGNALRKAYLCNAASRQVRPGATLLFYRSHNLSAVTAVGVVEEVLESRDPEEIARLVGRRTVYTLHDIGEKCRSARPALAILFRQDRLLEPAWPRRELDAAGVLNGHPQSITEVHREEGRRWLQQRLNEQR
jgi:L-amino acid N-acyltransferase YncA